VCGPGVRWTGLNGDGGGSGASVGAGAGAALVVVVRMGAVVVGEVRIGIGDSGRGIENGSGRGGCTRGVLCTKRDF
jgi:hypothetical protein